ncbi:hypothetical protein [Bacillus massiliglaciei]|uniref:hypothetical protein n=1 Tax=Bacillus massiliglaciei TaxID=1816693 RepID=UPI000DA5FB00|nr:hypothetical protein [Bacillus massiliglaciei]
MSDEKKNQESKPLLYIVQPDKVKEEPSVRTDMQSVYRTPKKKKKLQKEVPEKESSNKEEKKEGDNEQLETIKKEFGVYEVMKEIETEKQKVRAITNPYTQNQPAEETFENKEAFEETEVKPVKKKALSRPVNKETAEQIVTRLAAEGDETECEAVVYGEKIKFQILGKRGESVKIKGGNRIRYVNISDIENLKINPENGE